MMSKLMQRWDKDFASKHGGNTLLDLIWYRSYEWDFYNSNTDLLENREPDLNRFHMAGDLYDAGKISEALAMFIELAEQGSIWSMYEIGQCYEYGRGVSIDPIEAEKWFKRAFAGGSQVAMLRCAKASASRQDYSTCEKILQVGVDQDWAPAIFWQAWYRLMQSTNGATYRAILPALRTAARRGHPAAKFFLANYVVRGKFGLFRMPLGFLSAIVGGLSMASSLK
jgi:TPR repeat protein